MLRVSLVEKHSGKEISARALVDSGVEGMIINNAFAKKNKLSLQRCFPRVSSTEILSLISVSHGCANSWFWLSIMQLHCSLCLVLPINSLKFNKFTVVALYCIETFYKCGFLLQRQLQEQGQNYILVCKLVLIHYTHLIL